MPPNRESKFILDIQLVEVYNNIEICNQTNILKTYKQFKKEIQSNYSLYMKKRCFKRKLKFDLIISLNIIQEEGSNTASFVIFIRRWVCLGIKSVFKSIDIIQKLLSKFIENKLCDMVKK